MLLRVVAKPLSNVAVKTLIDTLIADVDLSSDSSQETFIKKLAIIANKRDSHVVFAMRGVLVKRLPGGSRGAVRVKEWGRSGLDWG